MRNHQPIIQVQSWVSDYFNSRNCVSVVSHCGLSHAAPTLLGASLPQRSCTAASAQGRVPSDGSAVLQVPKASQTIPLWPPPSCCSLTASKPHCLPQSGSPVSSSSECLPSQTSSLARPLPPTCRLCVDLGLPLLGCPPPGEPSFTHPLASS